MSEADKIRLNRRQAIAGSAALMLSASAGAGVRVTPEPAVAAALAESPLIYLSPLVSGGRESSCHAEIWFVQQKDDIFVVTWAEKWRARAMRRGFKRARMWIGDFGVWSPGKDDYRGAPSAEIEGRFESDPALHAALLAEFSKKYQSQWAAWDQRVRNGLTDGGWVLLHYWLVG